MSDRDTTGHVPSAQAEHEENNREYSSRKAENLMILHMQVIERRLQYLKESIASFQVKFLDTPRQIIPHSEMSFNVGVVSAMRSEIVFLENLLK